MPLLTAQDFPQIFAQPDESGLANGISQAFGYVRDDRLRAEANKRADEQQAQELQREKNKEMLAGRGRMYGLAASIEDPIEQRKAIVRMAQTADERGEPIEDFMSILGTTDPDQLRLNIAIAAKRLGDATGKIAKFQMGETRFAEDSEGNLYQVSAAFDPNNAETHGLMTPMEGSPEKPVGALSIVSRSGETPEGRMQREVKTREQIADIETESTLEQEEGKKEIALDWNARIAESVELAKVKAKDEGLAFTELEEMEASLPVLQESIAELRQLAEVATYTKGGKAFDILVRELGFGATEGATARAGYVAIVDNQVLPLLRLTFGAAFTVEEGKWLRSTMGNPDFSPEEKQAQLDAFITQKVRNIRAKHKRLDPKEETSGGGQVLRFDAQGNPL